MMEYPWGKGTPKWTRDATANDSDKSFTVPTGKIWIVKSITYTIVTTATAGNRAMRLRITNGTNLIAVGEVMDAIAASNSSTGAWIFGVPGGAAAALQPRLDTGATATVANWIRGMPDLVLLAGYVVQVLDSGTIDAAADDLTIAINYIEYDA